MLASEAVSEGQSFLNAASAGPLVVVIMPKMCHLVQVQGRLIQGNGFLGLVLIHAGDCCSLL